MALYDVLWALIGLDHASLSGVRKKPELVEISMFSAALATRILQLHNTTPCPLFFVRILVMKEDWVESEEKTV